jgi:hypothetical protein
MRRPSNRALHSPDSFGSSFQWQQPSPSSCWHLAQHMGILVEPTLAGPLVLSRLKPDHMDDLGSGIVSYSHDCSTKVFLEVITSAARDTDKHCIILYRQTIKRSLR